MQQAPPCDDPASPTVGAIAESPQFREWRDAFRELAGLNVCLIDGRAIDSGLRHATEATDWCRELGSGSDRCSGCRERFARRMKTHGRHHNGPFAMRCFAGLTVSALPLVLGDSSEAFLYACPVFVRGHRSVDTAAMLVQRAIATRASVSALRLHEAASSIPVCGRRHYRASISMLKMIAAQVSHLSRQMLAPPDPGRHEKLIVRRCCELLDRCFTEDIHVHQAATALGVSRSYLSHLLTGHLGMSFTDCLHRLRLAELKRLLADSELTITEAMFAAGFQSISQANRVFRSDTGMSPRDFRSNQRS